MFCNQCGKQIPEKSKFCNYCGREIVLIPTCEEQGLMRIPVIEGMEQCTDSPLNEDLIKTILINLGWSEDFDYYRRFNKNPAWHFIVVSPCEKKRVVNDHGNISLQTLGDHWSGEGVPDNLGMKNSVTEKELMQFIDY